MPEQHLRALYFDVDLSGVEGRIEAVHLAMGFVTGFVHMLRDMHLLRR